MTKNAASFGFYCQNKTVIVNKMQLSTCILELSKLICTSIYLSGAIRQSESRGRPCPQYIWHSCSWPLNLRGCIRCRACRCSSRGGSQWTSRPQQFPCPTTDGDGFLSDKMCRSLETYSIPGACHRLPPTGQ